MKVKWKENYNKECWEIKTPRSFPMARVIKEGDIPDLMEYISEPVSGNLWTTRVREGEITSFEQMIYWWYGYRTLEEIIRKKYKLGHRYFEILEKS